MIEILIGGGLLSTNFELIFNVMYMVIFEEDFFLFEGFLFQFIQFVFELVVIMLVDDFVLVGLLL